MSYDPDLYCPECDDDICENCGRCHNCEGTCADYEPADEEADDDGYEC